MSDPGYYEQLRTRFAVFTPHVSECGMQITALDADATEVTLPFREDWLGDPERRLIHPGIVTTMVDSACGAAVLARIGHLEPIATLDLRMDYLRRSEADHDLYCRAECFRLTANIAFCRARVWQSSEGDPIAISQSVFMRTQRGHPRTQS